jgi:hypothetical protein
MRRAIFPLCLALVRSLAGLREYKSKRSHAPLTQLARRADCPATVCPTAIIPILCSASGRLPIFFQGGSGTPFWRAFTAFPPAWPLLCLAPRGKAKQVVVRFSSHNPFCAVTIQLRAGGGNFGPRRGVPTIVTGITRGTIGLPLWGTDRIS